MSEKFFDRGWWKDFVVAIMATTVSIGLTFGTAALVDRKKQKEERKLTALMVMSSIESYARSLDEVANTWDRIDSIAVWLLRLPIDDVARLGDEPLQDAVDEVFGSPALSFDKTAETIFSSDLNTWKNVGNFQFIDNVGSCFSDMNWIEEQYKQITVDYRAAQARVYDNPPAYPGESLTEKLLRNTQVRQQLIQPHGNKEWLRYCADHLRILNRKNMKLIGISEEEVLSFTNARNVSEDDEEDNKYSNYQNPFPAKDSVDAHLDYARQIDSILRAKL